MSGFTVTVRVSSARLAPHGEGPYALHSALDELMAPFDEQTTDPRYLVFNDHTDEAKKGWKTETATRYRSPDGELLTPWNEKFRVPDTFGMGSGTHQPEKFSGYEKVEIPLKTLYRKFPEFCRAYHGYKQHPKTKRWGTQRNPNSKHNAWGIGFGESGYYPVAPERRLHDLNRNAHREFRDYTRADVVRLADINMKRVRSESSKKAGEFFTQYLALLKGELKDEYQTSRQASRIGLRSVVRGPAVAGPGQVVRSWKGQVPDQNEASPRLARSRRGSTPFLAAKCSLTFLLFFHICITFLPAP